MCAQSINEASTSERELLFSYELHTKLSLPVAAARVTRDVIITIHFCCEANLTFVAQGFTVLNLEAFWNDGGI